MGRKVNSFKATGPEPVLRSKRKAALNPPGVKPKPKVVPKPEPEPVVEPEPKPEPKPAKIKDQSQYEVGYDVGYKNGSKDGVKYAIHGFVATVEQKLAEHDGYKDSEKWRQEATIPAWWIAVLMSDWESKTGEAKTKSEQNTKEVKRRA